jgi:hypothetical protein
MPVKHAVTLTMSNEHPGVLRADADYFHARAEHCLRLADQARDPAASRALRRLAAAFEMKANSLQ